MSSILFLLFLLSLTTFSSKGRLTSDLGSSLAAPIFILFGYMISPQVFGLVLPSVLDSMTPALRVSIFLVAFISGFHFFRHWKSPSFSAALKENVRFFIPLSLFAVLLLALSVHFDILGMGFEAPWKLAGVGLILIGLFFKGWEILSILLVALGEACWRFQGLNFEFAKYFLVAFSIAAVLVMCAVLIVGKQESNSTPFRLALLGIFILGTGLATSASANEAFVGFICGGLIYFFQMKKGSREISTKDIETPLLLFIYFFMGLHLRVELYAFLLGAGFALIRILILLLMRKKQELSVDQVKIQRMAVPLAFSIYLSIALHLQTTFYLSTLTAGLIVTEVMGLQLLSKNRGQDA